MKPNTSKVWLSAICGGVLLLLNSTVFALGLGQARVSSYMQQPLDMRIDLISRSEAELATVTAGQASATDYQIMGLSASGLNTPLIFEVETDLDDPHIRVTSTRTVSDPVIQLVVEVVWSSGRMLKQYTLFLDPPAFQSSAPLPSSRAPVRSQAEVTPEPIPTPQASVPEPYEQEAGPVDVAEPAETVAEVQAPEPAVEAAEVKRDSGSAVQNDISSAGPPFNPLPSADLGVSEESDLQVSEALETGPTISPPEETEVEEVVNAEIASGVETVASDSPESAVPDDEASEPLTEPELVESAPTEAPVELVESGDASAIEVEETLAAVEESAVQTEAEPTPDDFESDMKPEPAQEVAQVPEPEQPQQNIAQTPEPEQPQQDIAQPPEPESVPESVPSEPEPVVADAGAEPEPAEALVSQQSATETESQDDEETSYKALLPETGQASTDHQVQRGETLWGIARDHARGTNTTVNQMMLAIQQQNQDAFNKGNINSLKSGAILRIPEASSASMMSARQAMLEVMRQEDHFRNRWDQPMEPADLPLISDMAPEPVPEAAPVQVAQAEDNRLELVPPSESMDASTQEFGQGNSGGDGVSSGESVVEALARAQEELANARQENEYLQDRLVELETELERAPEQEQDGLSDTQLAELEERLRQERLAGEAEEIAVMPPAEVKPWYARFAVWVIVLLVLIIMGLIWALTRQRKEIPVYVDGRIEEELSEETWQETPYEEQVHDHVAADDAQNQDREATSAGIADAAERIRNLQRIPEEEAVELDSSDPETQLDLARAYIAMNDAAAARRMLESVMEFGNEEQVAEAREMMGEL